MPGDTMSDTMTDVLRIGPDVQVFEKKRIDTKSTHGTGCTLSAAVTAGLANGKTLLDATKDALDFVHRAILTAPTLGAGNGPLNHFTYATNNDNTSD